MHNLILYHFTTNFRARTWLTATNYWQWLAQMRMLCILISLINFLKSKVSQQSLLTIASMLIPHKCTQLVSPSGTILTQLWTPSVPTMSLTVGGITAARCWKENTSACIEQIVEVHNIACGPFAPTLESMCWRMPQFTPSLSTMLQNQLPIWLDSSLEQVKDIEIPWTILQISHRQTPRSLPGANTLVKGNNESK